MIESDLVKDPSSQTAQELTLNGELFMKKGGAYG